MPADISIEQIKEVGMKSLTRLFILWVAAVAAAASAMVPTASHSIELSLTPAEALSGVTVEVGDAYPLTLGVTARPSTTYAVRSMSDGGIGACSTPTGTLTTDGAGSGSWRCDFTAGANPTTGALTLTISWEGRDLGYLRVLFTVVPVTVPVVEPVVEEPAPEVDEGEKADNHGGCVSYWAHRSKSEGLNGRARGAFISWIAQSDCTTSTREEAEFVTAFEEALAAQEAEAGAERSGQKPAKGGKDKHADEQDTDTEA